ncbi:cryptochrome/photolyase family protein [Ferruginibacter sp. SUN002]|uniref:cryptochrome/photolyase family protein n=1 Tax=Ferruginibacter sp. SUN002 TaxID=2937789 RepID=UPI003D3674C8
MQTINVCWFRRDLRLNDNAALYHALRDGLPVLPLFIFDKNILNKLEDKSDKRIAFIHAALLEMQEQLVKLGSTLEIFHSTPVEAFKTLLKKYTINKVFTNHDYELYAKERDEDISLLLKENGTAFHSFKDQVIFEKDEVLKDDGSPYTVFTPYSKKWKAKLKEFYFRSYPVEKYFNNLYRQSPVDIPSMNEIGFATSSTTIFPSKELDEELVKKYSAQRDFPGIAGTSKLGVHLRFGTVSIRQIVAQAITLNETYLNELIWREFYQMILWHFPKVSMGKAFKSDYDTIEWKRDEGEFIKWCEGQTGYPIVDAGMRELNATGFMHNRVRMIVASFLSKHLLLDWRLGEAYFAQKLLDFDFAANNGGWQWAAGCGCDAAPYFRVFNPYLQTQKFDPQLTYIKKWVPEFQEFNYPKPIVEHEFARKRALEVYGSALKKDAGIT